MRKNLMIIALAAIGLASCKGGFKQAAGGLLYNIHDDKAGTNIKAGDFITVNFVMKTEGDSVLYSTYEQGNPSPSIMPPTSRKGDITSGLLLLSEGDSASFKMNIDSVIQKGQPKPPGIKGKYIVYDMKIVKVIPRGSLSDIVFQGRIREYMKGQAEIKQKAEPAQINKYVADKKLNVTTTASGLRYQITKPGSGPNIVNGDTAVVEYTGSLLNGKIFDSSIKADAEKGAADSKMPIDPRRKYAPIRVAVGTNSVIKGWDEGLLLLNKGSKATFVVPSSIAFGDQGAPPLIPAFAPVTFTLEVVDIIKPNPNAPKTAAPQPPAVR